ncbi:hypothetical protein EYR41_011693 [Orbilia oligospora]|uniref:Uncharacterized protein n=1 Tax=Orbilia oligospora TaxID=2813651 RepID=A0A8H2DNE2_ORBOL|nr:hypothetical protein EYR41_011693 [Orbilia oligospora]
MVETVKLWDAKGELLASNEDLNGKASSANNHPITFQDTLILRVVIVPGEVGIWNIVIDKGASKNLTVPGQPLDWNAVSKDETYDSWVDFEPHQSFKRCENREQNSRFRDIIVGWEHKTLNTIHNKLNNLVALSTTVIMPTREVFTFAGLDTDVNGNLYSQVNYSNEGGVEIIKRQ